MRLLACGGRTFTDRDFVFEVLDRVHSKRAITLVIEGGAMGADSLARLWAISRKVHYKTERADWQRHGKRAGFIRNQAMLDDWQPEGVIAFPGGRGTADMVARAKAAGVTVYQPVYETS